MTILWPLQLNSLSLSFSLFAAEFAQVGTTCAQICAGHIGGLFKGQVDLSAALEWARLAADRLITGGLARRILEPPATCCKTLCLIKPPVPR